MTRNRRLNIAAPTAGVAAAAALLGAPADAVAIGSVQAEVVPDMPDPAADGAAFPDRGTVLVPVAVPITVSGEEPVVSGTDPQPSDTGVPAAAFSAVGGLALAGGVAPRSAGGTAGYAGRHRRHRTGPGASGRHRSGRHAAV